MLPTFNNIPIINKFSKYSQLNIIFYSMLIWVKKSIDLWVQKKEFVNFKEFCKKNNIKLKYDIKFVNSEDYNLYNKVIWSENLTTTKTIGMPIDSIEEWTIHCFISMNETQLDNVYKFWWYPVVTWNRVIYKSYHDLLEFWKHLWYPDCCVKYFFEKNDWRYYNFPYEIYKRSKKIDYRCNPFWKDHLGISYIYHMPCDFWCGNTIKYVNKIIKFLEKDEKENVKKIEEILQLPILSIREQKCYAFEWIISIDNLSISYKKFYHLWKKEEWDLTEYLEKWNIIKIEWKKVYIYKYKKLVFLYDSSISKEIETPFIIKFNKY